MSTVAHMVSCRCPTCLQSLAQGVFAYLVEQADGFVEVQIAALQELSTSGAAVMSCEVKGDRILVRLLTEEELTKDISRMVADD